MNRAINSTNLFSRFSSSAIFVLISRLLAFVAVFGFNAILARMLSPSEFGIFALMFSVSTLLCLVGSCGMNRALVKIIADESDLRQKLVSRRVMRFGLITVVACSCTLASIAFLVVANYLPSSSPAHVAILFASVVVVRNVHFVMAEAARGFHETKWSNLFGGPTGGPIPHLLFVALLIANFVNQRDMTLDSVLAYYLVSFGLTLPLLAIKYFSLGLPANSSLSESDPAITNGDTLILAIPIMLTQSFGLFLSQADVWLAGAFFIPGAIAIYCSAQRILAFLTIPLQISGTAIVPFVPELISKNQKSELQETVRLAAFVSGIPSLLIGGLLLAFPEEVLAIAFGSYYTQGAMILRILVVGQLVCVLTGPCEIVLMMSGHQKKTLVVNIAAATSIVLTGTIGAKFYGAAGLASAMAITTSVQNLFNFFIAKRLLGVSTAFQFSTLSPSYWRQIQAKLTRKGANADALC